MQLKKSIPKMLVAFVLSAVATTGISLILELILPQKLRYPYDYSAVFLAVLAPIAFSIIVIYLTKVFNGSGESSVWQEYPDKYPGIFRDLPRIVISEKTVILFIVAVGVLSTSLHFINEGFIHSKILSFIVSSMVAVTPLAIIINGVIGHLLGLLLSCIVYVITLALFRWKWRKFM